MNDFPGRLTDFVPVWVVFPDGTRMPYAEWTEKKTDPLGEAIRDDPERVGRAIQQRLRDLRSE